MALEGGRIAAIGELPGAQARHVVDGDGLALAPGFIDVHTHDDTNVIRTPGMLPKLAGRDHGGGGQLRHQRLARLAARRAAGSHEPAGRARGFSYPSFADYTRAIEAAQPAVNVAALVGHTALRNNHMDRLDRSATRDEVLAMREQLRGRWRTAPLA